MSAERPPWPTEEPNAETLTRFYVGEGQFFFGVMNRYVQEVIKPNDDPLLRERYLGAIGRMQHACDVVSALNALDVAEADALALVLWCAAESGDWYLELLWEWATAAGLDPDAIRAAGEAAAERSLT